MCLQALARLPKCKRYPDELYRSSRHVSVHKVINNSQKSFSLWFKHLLSSGHDQTIVYPEDSAWIEEQARWFKCNPVLSFMQILKQMKTSMSSYPWNYSVFKEWSPKDSQIEECSLWTSPRAFWKYITEKLKACGLKQSKLIHVFSLEVKSSVLLTVTTLSSGIKTQWTSITQRYSYAG